MIGTVKKFIKEKLTAPVPVKPSAEAYDIWAENYDAQPGNLMIDLDEQVFGELLQKVTIEQKSVADIGCGTGRHWKKLTERGPATLTGFDVSAGMLARLKQKFPEANISQINDDAFSDTPDALFEVIVSTLTVAHIPNIEQALNAWSRILKPHGDVIITDFHPHILARGGQRTFKHQDKTIAVQNFVHTVDDIKKLMQHNGFIIANEKQMVIDESMKLYYTNKNALSVYETYKGSPVIYGIHFTR